MKKKLKETKRYIIYLFVLALIEVFKKLPFTFCYKIADNIARLFSFFTHKEKTITYANVSYVNLKIHPEILFKKILKNMCYTFVEFIKFAFMKQKQLKKYFDVCGEDKLKQALKRRKGVILITGHIGNWELLGTYLGKNGYNVYAIYRKPSSKLYDKVIRRMRSRNNITLIDNSDAYRGSMEALKNNGILIILADQYPRTDGIDIDFLGKVANTPKGPAVFGIKAKSAILSAFVIRKKRGRGFKIIFKNIGSDIKGKLKDRINYILYNINMEYSHIISKYPDQWAWFHDRWGLF